MSEMVVAVCFYFAFLLPFCGCSVQMPANVSVNKNDDVKTVRLFPSRLDEGFIRCHCNFSLQPCDSDGTCVTKGGCAKRVDRYGGVKKVQYQTSELQQPMLPMSTTSTTTATVLPNNHLGISGTEPTNGSGTGEVTALNQTLRMLEEANEQSTGLSVGSGMGLPLMMQQSIARQIELPAPRSPIGTGRFGAVYKGLWKGEPVAVKIFKSVDEASWFREVQVFQTTMLRHPNILAFIASDNKGKPAMAHCDIKSKNILVKSDLSCCIGDMGMCVRYICDEGTKRYLAPELLDGSLNEHLFDSYRRADMYSFGLVLWEMARRTHCNGQVWPYELPYFDVVPADPTFDQMRRAVVQDGYRPAVPQAWLQHDVLQVVAKLMTECWAANPSARLMALRVKKTIDKEAEKVRAKKLSDDLGAL